MSMLLGYALLFMFAVPLGAHANALSKEDAVHIELVRLNSVSSPRLLREEGGRYKVSSRFVNRGQHRVIQGMMVFSKPEDEQGPQQTKEPHDHIEEYKSRQTIGSERILPAIEIKDFEYETLMEAEKNGDWNFSFSKDQLLSAVRERRTQLFGDLVLEEEEERLLDDIQYWEKSVLRKIPGFNDQPEKLKRTLENFRLNQKQSRMKLTDALVAESMSIEICAQEIDTFGGNDYSCAWLPVSVLLGFQSDRKKYGIDEFVLSPGESHAEMLNLHYRVSGHWLPGLSESFRFRDEGMIPRKKRHQ